MGFTKCQQDSDRKILSVGDTAPCIESTRSELTVRLSANATTDRRLHIQLRGPLGLNIGA